MEAIPVKCNQSKGGSERRGSPRHKVLKGGALFFNKGYGAMECQIRNLSDGGALLAFGDGSGVPPLFDLRVGGEAGHRHAKVRWRGMTRVGVSFE